MSEPDPIPEPAPPTVAELYADYLVALRALVDIWNKCRDADENEFTFWVPLKHRPLRFVVTKHFERIMHMKGHLVRWRECGESDRFVLGPSSKSTFNDNREHNYDMIYKDLRNTIRAIVQHNGLCDDCVKKARDIEIALVDLKYEHIEVVVEKED